MSHRLIRTISKELGSSLDSQTVYTVPANHKFVCFKKIATNGNESSGYVTISDSSGINSVVNGGDCDQIKEIFEAGDTITATQSVAGMNVSLMGILFDSGMAPVVLSNDDSSSSDSSSSSSSISATLSYIVSGAAEEGINGTYTDTGQTANGEPVYSNGSYYLGCDGYRYYKIMRLISDFTDEWAMEYYWRKDEIVGAYTVGSTGMSDNVVVTLASGNYSESSSQSSSSAPRVVQNGVIQSFSISNSSVFSDMNGLWHYNSSEECYYNMATGYALCRDTNNSGWHVCDELSNYIDYIYGDLIEGTNTGSWVNGVGTFTLTIND